MSALRKLAGQMAKGCLAGATITIIGCGDQPKHDMVGHWWNEVRPDHDVTTFAFNKDRTWSSSGPDEAPMRGTYEILGNTLYWHWEDHVLRSETTLRCALNWRDRDHLSITTQPGQRPVVEFNWERRSK